MGLVRVFKNVLNLLCKFANQSLIKLDWFEQLINKINNQKNIS